MAKPGQNEGFRVLDDFVSQAIPHPDPPVKIPKSRGKNEGLQVIQELVFNNPSPNVEPTGEQDTEEENSSKPQAEQTDVSVPMNQPPGWLPPTFFGNFIHAAIGALAGAAVQAIENACRRCGRSDSEFRLKCCQSPVCRSCLERTFSPTDQGGVTFQCPFCGTSFTEKASA